jgi:peptide deformylase
MTVPHLIKEYHIELCFFRNTLKMNFLHIAQKIFLNLSQNECVMKSMFKAGSFLLILMVVPFLLIGWLISCQKQGDRVSNFSKDQIEMITSGSADTKMRLLNWFIEEDSVILRKYSSNIRFYNDPNLTLFISRLYKTVIDPQHPGVGIAAPQVGISKRVIWVKRYDKTGAPFEVYLNAEILAYSDTLKMRPDGCLSIPGVNGQSYRAIWVEVRYNTTDGEQIVEKITHEYTAHIFQHEIDHLNGIVWLDRRNQEKKEGCTYIDNIPAEGLWLTEEVY